MTSLGIDSGDTRNLIPIGGSLVRFAQDGLGSRHAGAQRIEQALTGHWIKRQRCIADGKPPRPAGNSSGNAARIPDLDWSRPFQNAKAGGKMGGRGEARFLPVAMSLQSSGGLRTQVMAYSPTTIAKPARINPAVGQSLDQGSFRGGVLFRPCRLIHRDKRHAFMAIYAQVPQDARGTSSRVNQGAGANRHALVTLNDPVIVIAVQSVQCCL